jgi:hypothetical protein
MVFESVPSKGCIVLQTYNKIKHKRKIHKYGYHENRNKNRTAVSKETSRNVVDTFNKLKPTCSEDGTTYGTCLEVL